MAASSRDVVEDVERRRAQLQENVDKLRKALSHWTTCEVEYLTLREEIQNAGNPAPSQIRDIAREIAGTVVTEKEINELLSKDANSERNANQVVDLIDRRIDYVQQNSNTVEKQLNAAEKQLAGADVLLEPGVENEDGLPMMDIEEELDEEGNEIASSINQTGSSAKEIIEVLQKVAQQKASNAGTSTQSQAKNATPPAPVADDHMAVEEDPETADIEMKEPSPVASPPEPEMVEPTPKRKTGLEEYGYNEDIAAANFSRGTKVIELDDDDNMVASYPIIPQGESPEDAELRRQMLQYGLSEVGQVVAELDLDRPTASYSDDEDMDDDYNYDTDEEDEDEYGRSTRSALTDDYRKQMLELQKKLGMQNIGPQQDDPSLEEHAADIRTMKIQKDDQFDTAIASAASKDPEPKSKEPTAKKGVRFADNLDISDVPAPPQQSPKPPVLKQERVATISESIVERPVDNAVPVEPPKPAKVSKFKMGRTVQQMPAHTTTEQSEPVYSPPPSGPAGRTLANTITEHQASSSTPLAPDEFDPALINREIEADYHKARNKFIQQQGGFKQGPEDEEEVVFENEDGTTKKVSRFMAARLKSSGL